MSKHQIYTTSRVTLHVSVWVEIFLKKFYFLCITVTLHVSVWVEIVIITAPCLRNTRHAPRERVSWNVHATPLLVRGVSHAPRERVSWNFISYYTWLAHHRSRSTWACELKFLQGCSAGNSSCHAPRERVSWNDTIGIARFQVFVTLHVSVWVEIGGCFLDAHKRLRHAPRERVSWNLLLRLFVKSL